MTIYEKSVVEDFMVKKYAYIDALRGFAVLGVILVHCGLRFTDLPTWLKSITVQGERGVQLFFILSALTLFLSMKQRSSFEDERTIDFFIRRFFRIAPLFYLAAVIYSFRDILLNHFSTGGYNGFNLFNFVSTFLFFTNDLIPSWINKVVPGGWSITVEMTFYLFLPILFKKIKTLRAAIIFTFISFAIAFVANFLYRLVATEMLDKTTLDSYLFYWFPNQLPVFSLGMLSYFLIDKTKNIHFNKIWGFLGIFVGFLILLLLAVSNITNSSIHFIFSIVFVYIVWLFSKFNSKLIINKITVLIGKLSFSMYLTHFLVIQFVGVITNHIRASSELQFIVLYLITVIVTAGVSFISYKVIEKPFINLGNNLITRMKIKTVRNKQEIV